MQQQTSFILGVSGQPMIIPNTLQNSSSLTVNYSLTDLSTATVYCEGILDGAAIVLDTYTGGSVTNRSISLVLSPPVVFDSFRFVAIFSGTQQSAVSVLLSSSGSGATFSAAQNLTNVHTQ